MLYALYLTGLLAIDPQVIEHDMPVQVEWIEAICADRHPACTIIETRERVCFSQSTGEEPVIVHCYPKQKDYV